MRSLAHAATLVLMIGAVGSLSAAEIVEHEVTEKTTTKYSGTSPESIRDRRPSFSSPSLPSRRTAT